MINDIFPHQFNNQFIASKHIEDADYVLHFSQNSLLLKQNGHGFELPRKKDVNGIYDTSAGTFLFSYDNAPCFLLWDSPKTVNGQLSYQESNLFRDFPQQEIAWVSIVGHQMKNWYLENKYCGKCGSKTIEKPDERAIMCPNCNHLVFPKISPAIIVAITCGDKILMAKNANFRVDWYSIIAGYADVGESLEETVIREVKEEVGVDITNLRYYKSQPWPVSGSMMIGFFAEADCNQSIKIDNKEITHAAWFTRGNLPNHPNNFSIAGELIDLFEKGEI